MIGFDQIFAFIFGHGIAKQRPFLRPEPGHAAAIKPVKLFARHQENATQHQVSGSVGMGLRINQRQGRSPGAAKNDPTLDPKGNPDAFNIRDQIPCRVVFHARMGRGPPASALIEQDHPVMARIKETSHPGAASATGPAMQDHHRLALRIAALLDVNLMPARHVHVALGKGLNRRVKLAPRFCSDTARVFAHLPYMSQSMTRKPSQVVKGSAMQSQSTIDPSEIAKFEAMASEWWDPNGKFKPLHMLNPCRLDYIIDQVSAEFMRNPKKPRPFEGLRFLDIGCGGGLLCEPMARLGADVIGADAAERNIPVARVHAEKMGLAIDYRHTSAEALADAGEQFDIVLNMEVVEHVADPQAYLTACQQLLKPGGLMICSTLNRNPKSYMMAIIGAEHVMRWLPKGTHEWSKFITPDELFGLIETAGLTPVDRKGFVFNPLSWSWSISDRDLSVNYVTTSTKPV